MNNSDGINVVVCSDLEHENLVAEITINGRFIGLVTDEPNKDLCFEIPQGQLSLESVSLDLFEKAIAIARRRLEDMGPKET